MLLDPNQYIKMPKPKQKQSKQKEHQRNLDKKENSEEREWEKHTLYVRYGEIAANVRRRRWWFGPSAPDSPTLDSSEQVYISSLALPQNAQTRYSSLSLSLSL